MRGTRVMIQKGTLFEESEVTLAQITIFISVQLLLLFITASLDIAQYLPLVIVAILYFFWSINRPQIWIFTVILLYILILDRSEGVTIWEALYAVYFFGVISLWFIQKLVNNEKIVYNTADQLLLVFFALCILSIVPGILGQASVIKWFRELMIFSAYLFYFPAREAIFRYKAVPWIGIGFLILATYIAVSNFIKYKTAASSAVYLWQLISGRQTANEPLFLTAILIGICLYLFLNSHVFQMFLLAVISFFTIALAVTFSRGYWFGLFVGIATVILLLKGKQRRKFILTMSILSTLALLVLFIFFSATGLAILQSMGQRFISGSLSAGQDISLQSRLSESNAVIDAIKINPILGYGLGVFFKFPDPILKITSESWYIHNGYLFLWFKLGFFGMLSFLLVYMLMIRDAYKLYIGQSHTFESHLLLGISAVLVSMLIISLTSPQFITRDSILIISLGWAIIGAFRLKNVTEIQSAT